MEIKIVKKTEEFLVLKDEWNRINSSQVPFLKFDWQYNWWLAYKNQHAGDSLYIIIIKDQGVVKAIIPGFISSKHVLGKKITTWQFLSGLLESKDLDAISSENNPRNFTSVLSKIFNDKKVHVWNFHFLLPNSFLYEALKEAQSLTKNILEGEYLVIKNQKNFDDYIKILKPRMRTKVRKMVKEAVKLELKVNLVNDQDSLDDFINLHQVRWEAEGKIGAFGGYKKYRIDFFKKNLLWLIQSGIMRIYSLTMNDGRVLGYKQFFIADNEIYLFQEAHAYQNDVVKTPGNLLRALVLKEVMDEGKYDYDFMDGTSFHKSSWGPESMKKYDITIYKSQIVQSFVQKTNLLKGKFNGLKAKLKRS